MNTLPPVTDNTLKTLRELVAQLNLRIAELERRIVKLEASTAGGRKPGW